MVGEHDLDRAADQPVLALRIAVEPTVDQGPLGEFNGDDHTDVAFGQFGNSRIRAVFGSESGELSRAITVARREVSRPPRRT